MQSRIRCRLYVAESMYDVTNDLINWDDIYSKLKRVNYGGVMRSFAGKFEFARKAREIIREDLMNNMVYSAPRLVWYERDESWAWKEVFSYVLDASSYDDDGSVVSISAVDNSLETIIKAKKGTQYEYSVDVIKEEKTLWYDRININNSAQYYPYDKNYDVENPKPSTDDEIIINTNTQKYYQLPLQYSDVGEVYNQSVVSILDHTQESSYGAIMEFKGTQKVIISMKFHVKRSEHSAFSINFDIIEGSSSTVAGKFYIGSGDDFDVDYSFEIPSRYTAPGNKLRILFPGGGYKSWVAISKFEYFRVTYNSVDSPVNIDIVSPKKLLNRLLKSMNGGKKGFMGEIVSGVDDRIDDCVIVAAESVRGLPKAKLYTSFTKFCDWMSSVFGFVYEIDGEVVHFAHRDSMYSRVVVGNIGTDASEFNCKIEPSLIYSQVNVGYNKQDYDSINGRDEFRFTTEYSTGITLTNNKFELISPYRADAYGIEFLAQKRGADTTDKDSDNDVFFVGAKMSADGARWELVRGGKYQLSGVISPDTMFNAMFSPRQMLLANKAFIGVSVDTLEYASSNGNSDVAVGGIEEKEGVKIGRSEALFLPMSVEVKTSRQELPDSKKGLIMIEYDGELYRGFIDDIERYHGKSKSNSYNLMLFDISKIT